MGNTETNDKYENIDFGDLSNVKDQILYLIDTFKYDNREAIDIIKNEYFQKTTTDLPEKIVQAISLPTSIVIGEDIFKILDSELGFIFATNEGEMPSSVELFGTVLTITNEESTLELNSHILDSLAFFNSDDEEQKNVAKTFLEDVVNGIIDLISQTDINNFSPRKLLVNCIPYYNTRINRNIINTNKHMSQHTINGGFLVTGNITVSGMWTSRGSDILMGT